MKKLILSSFLGLVIHTTSAYGQISNSQERFQDFFATAGYGTAFGAALGAATLPFQDNPEKHLRSVAIGASLGFFTGSLLGSYIIFSPAIAEEKRREPTLTLSPITDKNSLAFTGISGTWTISRF